MNNKIWLSSPHMGGNELKYVNEAFETNWIAPLGPNVDNFEKDLCAFTGAKYAAALSSGTAAIHLALIQLGVQAGDEVICSTFTFSATANPILYQGAIPIFVDSEELTWNMSPLLLRKVIMDRTAKGKKPKAIIVVHLYGMPAQVEAIMEIANHFEIPVIEDAAEALGSTYKGQALGTFGKVGILSFNGNKIITTSGGGALISDDEDFVKQSRFLATQARDNAPHYQHSHIGYNYRMSNVAAGIGRGQMEVINQRVDQRRYNFEFYKRHLAKNKSIQFLEEPNENYFSNRWLSCILLENYEQREILRLALEKENIESRPLWKPMHLQPIFQKYPKYVNSTSEKLFERGLCLPSGSNLELMELNKTLNGINSMIR
jgi:dTDP-4-amino-4,6-dideoxygalactose transaminase